MRMSEKCRNKHNNNSDNPLTSRRNDGGKNIYVGLNSFTWVLGAFF